MAAAHRYTEQTGACTHTDLFGSHQAEQLAQGRECVAGTSEWTSSFLVEPLAQQWQLWLWATQHCLIGLATLGWQRLAGALVPRQQHGPVAMCLSTSTCALFCPGPQQPS